MILDVTPPVPTYEIELNSSIEMIRVNETVKISLTAYSILGFDEPLTFGYDGLPDTIEITFAPQYIIPTAKTEMSITVLPGTELSDYNITLNAKSNGTGIKRLTWFNLKVARELPKFQITVELNDEMIVKEGENAELLLTIVPIAGFKDEVNIRLHGLEGDMTWNSESSPLYLEKTEVIPIMISDLTIPKEFILRLEIFGRNHTEEHEFSLDVVPKDDNQQSTVAGINNDILMILVLIVFLMIIIVAFSKVSKTAEKRPERRRKEPDSEPYDPKSSQKSSSERKR
jgi:hypothetical protein